MEQLLWFGQVLASAVSLSLRYYHIYKYMCNWPTCVVSKWFIFFACLFLPLCTGNGFTTDNQKGNPWPQSPSKARLAFAQNRSQDHFLDPTCQAPTETAKAPFQGSEIHCQDLRKPWSIPNPIFPSVQVRHGTILLDDSSTFPVRDGFSFDLTTFPPDSACPD